MKLKSSERRMKLILMLQQSNDRLTVAKLAEKFNVSERTIYRDFNVLSDLNVPVTWDQYQGYGVVKGYSVPPLMFTSKELAVIMIGLNFVKSQIDQSLVEDANGVELKIKDTLPDELLAFMDSIGKRTVVDPYLNFGPKKKKGSNWFPISSAIAENTTIRFDYTSLKDEHVTIRKLDPYLIVFYGDHWNVIGYSHKRDALRNFILDRITNITETEESFTRDNTGIEPLIYRTTDATRKIKVKIDSEILEQFRSNVPAKIEQIDKRKNTHLVTFHFDNLIYINEWLLQFGNKVSVKAPEELQKKRNRLLKSMISE